jgi:hypothetical protein
LAQEYFRQGLKLARDGARIKAKKEEMQLAET